MLDEREYAALSEVHRQSILTVKEHRKASGVDLKDPTIQERMVPVLDAYEQLTGYRETNPNAVMHHRLSLYGPPCKRCGRPLRTPTAKLCGSCMISV